MARQSVSDRGFVTANGTVPLEFAIDILLALNVADESRVMEWYAFHKLGFYTVPLPKHNDENTIHQTAARLRAKHKIF